MKTNVSNKAQKDQKQRQRELNNTAQVSLFQVLETICCMFEHDAMKPKVSSYERKPSVSVLEARNTKLQVYETDRRMNFRLFNIQKIELQTGRHIGFVQYYLHHTVLLCHGHAAVQPSAKPQTETA